MGQILVQRKLQAWSVKRAMAIMAMSRSTKGASVASVGLLIVIVAAVLGWYGLPSIVRKRISKEIILKNGTEAWESFVKLKAPLHFKVYFFNVTNPEEVQNGTEKPKLTELGPYVYNEYREKVWIQVNENSTVSYKQNQIYEFNSNLSDGLTEDDIVTILNPALVVTVNMALDDLATPSFMVDMVTEAVFNATDLFLTDSVRNILFDGVKLNCQGGLAEVACRRLEPHLPDLIIREDDGDMSFAFFRHKNFTDDGTYTVRTGETDTSLLGDIETWNNGSRVDTWNGDTCNMINGTDSMVFRPYLSRHDVLYIFISDACRSLYLTYDEDFNYKGMSGYRYVIDGNVFADVNLNPDNNCFCLNEKCLKSGLWDLSTCQKFPLFLSLPHFYTADDEYQNGVDGLEPMKEKHETYVDVEPDFGVPIRGSKRTQLNIFLKRSEVKFFENVKDTLFPIVWLDEAGNLEEHIVDRLRDIVGHIRIINIVDYLLLGSGVIIVLLGALMFVQSNVACEEEADETSFSSAKRKKPDTPVFAKRISFGSHDGSTTTSEGQTNLNLRQLNYKGD